jgi:phage tail sheath protein FI
MAEVLISPGVLAIENDQSQITSQPVQAGAAIVGPTAKGRINIPTLVTTYSEYLANFGSTFTSASDTYTFLTSISAFNYFQNGGTSLLVTRVVSESVAWAPATSSFISASLGSLGSAFTLETLSPGTIMNSTSTEVSGSLPSGSADNYRWQIVSPNTASGVFSLIIRQGNDNSRNPSILETFTNLSLDPKSPNYIARVIGDQTITVQGSGANVYLQTTGSYPNASRYIRVKSVNIKTPDYLDNNGVAKPQYTASIPIAASGSFGAGTGDNVKAGMKLYDAITSTDTQGLVGDSYTTALNLLANPNEFRYNIISVPGLTIDAYPTPISTLITNIENRGDAIVVVDPSLYGSTVATTIGNAASQDSSYASSYWPWCQTTDPNTGQLVWVPASTMIPGVYAYTDKVSEPWFAPAGINRGGLGTVRQVERKLTQTDKDNLYTGKVNPLATLPGRGVVVYGQKTLQTKASALDRVNVRRLLISLKSYISQVADNLVFEQNTAATRNQFLSQVNPYLDSVQQRQGLYAFKVVMDDTNNTADVIDRNQLVGAIYLQPTKTAEFIYLNFNILPTGATFPG